MEVLIPFVMAELIDKGITVHIGHSAENIAGAQCIIRTAAAHNDNPEIAAARAAYDALTDAEQSQVNNLDRLTEAGAAVYRTDQAGDITITR